MMFIMQILMLFLCLGFSTSSENICDDTGMENYPFLIIRLGKSAYI